MDRPVSYPALGFVLTHLEPNLRFQLNTRCPSIHNLEKSVQLHIRYLKLTDHRIMINRFTYLLTVFHQNPQFDFDVDQHGNQDTSQIAQDPNEVRLDVRVAFRFRDNVANNLSKPKGLFTSRFNLVPVVENCLLLQRSNRAVEVLSWQSKMHEALKYMLGKLFGGRCVKVNQLAIGCETILRVPSTVKFNVKILEILDANVYNNLGTICSIIQDSSLAFNKVKFRIESLKTANNPIILAARTLHIHATRAPVYGDDPIGALARQTNRRVHFEFWGEVLVLWYQKVLKCWMRHGKKPGTHYTFETDKVEINQAMAHIRKAYRKKVRQAAKNRITLNLNETSKLIIRKFQSFKGNSWILEMKVEGR